MKIAIAVVLLMVAIFLVIKGGDIFVSSATDIAKRAHIPQLLFGATIVSLATTLPELLIGILSSVDGTTGLAVGNSVGSAICNVGLISGVAFVLMPCDMSRGGFLKYYLNLVVVFALLGFGLFFNLVTWQGVVLAVLAVLFFVINYIDVKLIDKNKKKKTKKQDEPLKPLWLTILLFVLGASAIGGGAYLLVDKVEYLSKVIGVSEQFVGLTVVAIGTSLPELITVFNSIKNKSPYLAIGNIIGSNILNLALILGVSRLVAWNYNMQITKETAYITLPILCLLTLIMILPILFKKKTYKWQGIVLLILYAMYIIYLILNAILGFI